MKGDNIKKNLCLPYKMYMYLYVIKEYKRALISNGFPSLLLLDTKSHCVAYEYFPLNYGTIMALELH